MEIVTTGRTDLDDLWRLSGLLDGKLNHTPFLAFLAEGDNVRVRVVETAVGLTAYPDDTPVMAQWAGKWRSDFFRFTVGDVRAALEAHAERERRRAAYYAASPAERAKMEYPA